MSSDVLNILDGGEKKLRKDTDVISNRAAKNSDIKWGASGTIIGEYNDEEEEKRKELWLATRSYYYNVQKSKDLSEYANLSDTQKTYINISIPDSGYDEETGSLNASGETFLTYLTNLFTRKGQLENSIANSGDPAKYVSQLKSVNSQIQAAAIQGSLEKKKKIDAELEEIDKKIDTVNDKIKEDKKSFYDTYSVYGDRSPVSYNVPSYTPPSDLQNELNTLRSNRRLLKETRSALEDLSDPSNRKIVNRWRGFSSKSGIDQMMSMNILPSIDEHRVGKIREKIKIAEENGLQPDVSEDEMDLLRNYLLKEEILGTMPEKWTAGLNFANTVAYTEQFLAVEALTAPFTGGTGGALVTGASMLGRGVLKESLKEGGKAAFKAAWNLGLKEALKDDLRTFLAVSFLNPQQFIYQYNQELNQDIRIVEDNNGNEFAVITGARKQAFIDEYNKEIDSYNTLLGQIATNELMSKEQKEQQIAQINNQILELKQKMSMLVDEKGKPIVSGSETAVGFKTAWGIAQENLTETFGGGLLGRTGRAIKVSSRFAKPNKFTTFYRNMLQKPVIKQTSKAINYTSKGIGKGSKWVQKNLNKAGLGYTWQGVPEEIGEEVMSQLLPDRFGEGWFDEYAEQVRELTPGKGFYSEVALSTLLLGAMHSPIAVASTQKQKIDAVNNIMRMSLSNLNEPEVMTRAEARKKYNKQLNYYEKINKTLDDISNNIYKDETSGEVLIDVLSRLANGYSDGNEDIAKVINQLKGKKLDDVAAMIGNIWSNNILNEALRTGTVDQLREAVFSALLPKNQSLLTDAEKNLLTSIDSQLETFQKIQDQYSNKYYYNELVSAYAMKTRYDIDSTYMRQLLSKNLKDNAEDWSITDEAVGNTIDSFLTAAENTLQTFRLKSDYLSTIADYEGDDQEILARKEEARSLLAQIEDEFFNGLNDAVNSLGDNGKIISDNLSKPTAKSIANLFSAYHTSLSISKRFQERLDKYMNPDNEQALVNEVKAKRKKEILSTYAANLIKDPNMSEQKKKDLQERTKLLGKRFLLNITNADFQSKQKEADKEISEIREERTDALRKTYLQDQEDKKKSHKERKTQIRQKKANVLISKIENAITQYLADGTLQVGSVFKIEHSGDARNNKFFIVGENGSIINIKAPSLKDQKRMDIVILNETGERIGLPPITVSREERAALQQLSDEIEQRADENAEKFDNNEPVNTEGIVEPEVKEAQDEAQANSDYVDVEDPTEFYMPNVTSDSYKKSLESAAKGMAEDIVNNNIDVYNYLYNYVRQLNMAPDFNFFAMVRHYVDGRQPSWDISDEDLKTLVGDTFNLYKSINNLVHPSEVQPVIIQNVTTEVKEKKEKKENKEKKEKPKKKQITSVVDDNNTITYPITDSTIIDRLKNNDAITIAFDMSLLRDRNTTIIIEGKEVNLREFLKHEGIDIDEIEDIEDDETLFNELKNLDENKFMFLCSVLPISLHQGPRKAKFHNCITNEFDNTYFNLCDEVYSQIRKLRAELYSENGSSFNMSDIDALIFKLKQSILQQTTGEMLTENELREILETYLSDESINKVIAAANQSLNAKKDNIRELRSYLALSKNGHLTSVVKKNNEIFPNQDKMQPLSEMNNEAIPIFIQVKETPGSSNKTQTESTEETQTETSDENKWERPEIIIKSAGLIKEANLDSQYLTEKFFAHSFDNGSKSGMFVAYLLPNGLYYVKHVDTRYIESKASEKQKQLFKRFTESLEFIKGVLSGKTGTYYVNDIRVEITDANIDEYKYAIGKSLQGNNKNLKSYLKGLNLITPRTNKNWNFQQIQIRCDLNGYSDENKVIPQSEFEFPIILGFERDEYGISIIKDEKYNSYQDICYEFVKTNLKSNSTKTLRNGAQVNTINPVTKASLMLTELDEEITVPANALTTTGDISGTVTPTPTPYIDYMEPITDSSLIPTDAPVTAATETPTTTIQEKTTSEAKEERIKNATREDYLHAIENNFGIVQDIVHTIFKEFYFKEEITKRDLCIAAEKELDKRIAELSQSENTYARLYADHLKENKEDILGIAVGSEYPGSILNALDDFFRSKKSDQEEIATEDADESTVEKQLNAESFTKPVEDSMSIRGRIFLAGIKKSESRRQTGNPFIDEYEDFSEMLYGVQDALWLAPEGTIEGAIKQLNNKVGMARPSRKLLVGKDKNGNPIRQSVGVSFGFLKDLSERLKLLVTPIEDPQLDEQRQALKASLEYVLYNNKVVMDYVNMWKQERTNQVGMSYFRTSTLVQDANSKSAIEGRLGKIPLFIKTSPIIKTVISGGKSKKIIDRAQVQKFIDAVEALWDGDKDNQLWQDLSYTAQSTARDVKVTAFAKVSDLFAMIGIPMDACTIMDIISSGELVYSSLGKGRRSDILDFLHGVAEGMKENYLPKDDNGRNIGAVVTNMSQTKIEINGKYTELPPYFSVKLLKSVVLPRDIKFTFNPVRGIYNGGKRVQATEQARYINEQLKRIINGVFGDNPKGNKLIENLKKCPSSRYSFLLNLLTSKDTPKEVKDALRENLSVRMTALNTLKVNGNSSGKDGKGFTQLPLDDQLAMMIALSQGTPNISKINYGKEKTIEITERKKDGSLKKKKIDHPTDTIQLDLAETTFPALADAEIMPVLTTIVMRLTNSNLKVENGMFVSETLNQILYNSLVKGELFRIICYYKAQLDKDGSGVMGIDEGGPIFNMIPTLNGITFGEEGSKKTFPQYIRDLVKANMQYDAPTLAQMIYDSNKQKILKTLYTIVESEADRMAEIIHDDNILIDTQYKNSITSGIADDKEEKDEKGKVKPIPKKQTKKYKQAKVIALNAVINNFISYADIIQLFSGDSSAYATDKLPKYFVGNTVDLNIDEVIKFAMETEASSEDLDLLAEAIASGNVDAFIEDLKDDADKEKVRTLNAKFLDYNGQGYSKAVAIVYENYLDLCGRNMAKRLKGLISPGNLESGTLSEKRETTQLMIEDTGASSDILESLFSNWYENSNMSKADKERIMKEIKEFKEIEEKFLSLENSDLSDDDKKTIENEFKEKRKNLMKELPDIAEYFKIDDTDGQEYCTWRNFLDQLLHQGRLLPSEYEYYKAKLESQSRDGINESNRLTREDLIRFQPTKPRYYGMHFKEVNGYLFQTPVFIKTASFPLIPQLTEGFAMDKLRKVMENIEEGSKTGSEETGYTYRTVRASYNTGNKVGGRTRAMSFEQLTSNRMMERVESGENLLEADDFNDSLVTLDKDNYFIQQDKPFDTDENIKQNKRDEVARTTQMEKTILANGISKIEDKIFPAEEFSDETLIACGISIEDKKNINISGEDLFKIYNYLYEREQKYLEKKLFDRLGIKSYKDFGNEASIRRVQKILNKQLSEMQDLEGIELVWRLKRGIETIEMSDEDYSKLSDKEKEQYSSSQLSFRFPIMTLPGSIKFASVLNSVVNKNSIRLKFPGSHGVVASQKGFSTKPKIVSQEDFFNSEEYKQYVSEVVFCPGFDGSLKASEKDPETGKIKAAQVLVASKFTTYDSLTHKTTLIDIRDYAIKDEKTGRLYLDTERVPEEVLKMFSFRIPVSSHQSGMLIQIAGFLPPQCADLMIVPKESVTQMGEDFDIDIRYCYRSNVQEVERDGVKRLEFVSTLDIKDNATFSQAAEDDYYNLLSSVEDFVRTNNKLKKEVDPLMEEYGFSKIYEYAVEYLTLEDDIKKAPKPKTKEEKEYILGTIKATRQINREFLETVSNGNIVTKQNILRVANILRSTPADRLDKVKSYVIKLKNDELRYRVLENDLMAIYKSVYASPNEEVQQKITAVLKTDFIGNTADEIQRIIDVKEKQKSTSRRYYSFLSPLTQLEMINRGNSGRIGIGAWSSVLVFVGLVQQCEAPIKFRIDGRGTIRFGNIEWDGTLGGVYDEKTKAYRCLKPNNAADDFKTRPIADGIEECQNASTDNLKKFIMYKRNENQYTFSAYQMMAIAGIDKDGFVANGIEMSYPSLFMSQPIIRDFVVESERSDALANGTRTTRRADIVDKLMKKYSSIHGISADADGLGLTGEKLYSYLGGVSNDADADVKNEFNHHQQQVLQLFILLSDMFDVVRPYMTEFNLESRGLGVNFSKVINKKDLVLHLLEGGETDKIEGLQQLVGDMKVVDPNNEIAVPDRRFDITFSEFVSHYSLSSTKYREKSLYKPTEINIVTDTESRLSMGFEADENESINYSFKRQIGRKEEEISVNVRSLKDLYAVVKARVIGAEIFDEDGKTLRHNLYEEMFDTSLNKEQETKLRVLYSQAVVGYFSPEKNPQGLNELLSFFKLDTRTEEVKDSRGKVVKGKDGKPKTQEVEYISNADDLSIEVEDEEETPNLKDEIKIREMTKIAILGAFNYYNKEIPTFSSNLDFDSTPGLRSRGNNETTWIQAVNNGTKTQITLSGTYAARLNSSINKESTSINKDGTREKPVVYRRFANNETGESVIVQIEDGNKIVSLDDINVDEWSQNEGLSNEYFEDKWQPMIKDKKGVYIFEIAPLEGSFYTNKKELNTNESLPKLNITESLISDQQYVVNENTDQADVTVYFYSDSYSKDMKTVKEHAESIGKDCITISIPFEDAKAAAQNIAGQIIQLGLSGKSNLVINIAGDTYDSIQRLFPDKNQKRMAQQVTDQVIADVIDQLQKEINIGTILSNGFSGVSESVVKATANTNIPVRILAPQGYGYTSKRKGNHTIMVKSQTAFIARFPNHETTSVHGIQSANTFQIYDEDVAILKQMEADNQNIELNEEDHTYTVNGKPADLSVTQLAAELTKKKDEEEVQAVDENNLGFLEVGSYLGNIYDRMNRDFFSGRLANPEAYDGITEEQYQQIIERMSKAKMQLDKKFGVGKYMMITDENLLKVSGYVTIDGKQQLIAGTIDMIIIDENGRWYLYDFKTNRVHSDNTGADMSQEKMRKYYHQLIAYRELLIRKYPVLADKISKDVNLIVYNVCYQTPSASAKQGQNGIRYFKNQDGILGAEVNGEFKPFGELRSTKLDNSVKIVNPLEGGLTQGFTDMFLDKENISVDEQSLYPTSVSNPLSESEVMEQEEILKQNGYAYFCTKPNGQIVYIKPSNFYAQKIVHSISQGYNLWKNIFPYESPTLKDIVDHTLQNCDVKPFSQSSVDLREQITSDFKDFLYRALMMYNANNTPGGIDGITGRLFMDKIGQNDSLATYLSNLERLGITAHLPFFKNLTYRFNFDGSGPSIIQYNVNNEGLGEGANIYFMFENLFNNGEIIKDKVGNPITWNGETMTWRKLTIYLTQYAFLSNQEGGAIGFRKYIPIKIFDNLLSKNSKGKEISMSKELMSLVTDSRISILAQSGKEYIEGLLNSRYSYTEGKIPNIHNVPINYIKTRVDLLNTEYGEEILTMNESGDVFISPMKLYSISLRIFETQFFQHNPELAHRVSRSIVEKNNKIVGMRIDPKYNYVSVMGEDGEIHLYARIGNYFEEINKLGGFGLNEYKPYIPNTHSVFQKNNIEGSGNTILFKSERDETSTKNMVMDYKSAHGLLEDIAGSFSEDDQIKQTVTLLMNIVPPQAMKDCKIKDMYIGNGKPENYPLAKYNMEYNTIYVNKEAMKLKTPEEQYKALLHEYMHCLTATIFKEYINNVSLVWDQGKDEFVFSFSVKEDAPLGFHKFISVYKQALHEMQKIPEFKKDLFNYQSQIGNKQGSKNTYNKKMGAYVDSGVYQMSNIYEFVADMFFNDNIVNTLLSTGYQSENEESDRSWKEIFKNFIKTVLNILKKMYKHVDNIVDDNLMDNAVEALYDIFRERSSSAIESSINSSAYDMETGLMNEQASPENVAEFSDAATEKIINQFYNNYRSIPMPDVNNIPSIEEPTIFYYPNVIDSTDIKVSGETTINGIEYQLLEIPGVEKFDYGVSHKNGVYRVHAIIADSVIIDTNVVGETLLDVIDSMSEICSNFAERDVESLNNPNLLNNNIEYDEFNINKIKLC